MYCHVDGPLPIVAVPAELAPTGPWPTSIPTFQHLPKAFKSRSMQIPYDPFKVWIRETLLERWGSATSFFVTLQTWNHVQEEANIQASWCFTGHSNFWTVDFHFTNVCQKFIQQSFGYYLMCQNHPLPLHDHGGTDLCLACTLGTWWAA